MLQKHGPLYAGNILDLRIMHTKTKAWLTVVAAVALIKLFSLFPAAVERYYSNGVYLWITRSLRFLFGWIPFSMGDLLYLCTGIYLLVKLLQFLRAIIKKKANKLFLWHALRWLGFYCLLVYAIFNILWGLNYNRLGMAYQMQLQLKPYSTEELHQVMQALVQRLDTTSIKALATRNRYLNKKMLFGESYNSYRQAEQRYPTWCIIPAV